MNGIFISHSTQNKDLTEQMIELLQSGMGIGRERIFCTSLNGALSTGEDFVRTIKENMKECEMVIALVTPEYLKSPFCLMELGAAWIQGTFLCPILSEGVDYTDLDGTPLKGMQMRKLTNEDDLFAVYDEMVVRKMIVADTKRFNRKVRDLMKNISMWKNNGKYMISPEPDGSYEIIIEEERMVPRPFKCYKIKGNLDLGGVQKDDETHWIFFREGMFEELEKGSHVSIRVGKTNRKYFDDIGWARNIYLEELQKI